MATLLEKNGSGYDKYNTIFVEPEKLSALSNSLALNILEKLSEKPMCAMDLAREMDTHEQKIYYHLNKLQRSGLVKLIGTEKRYGMVAQMYGTVASAVAAKLHSNGKQKIEKPGFLKEPEAEELLKPFIEEGKLNAKIVVGDPYPHGRFETGGLDGCYATDVAMFLGNFVQDLELPCYKLDIHLNEKDIMTNNLILVGSIKTNSAIDRINDKLPLFFDEDREHSIVRKSDGKVYDNDFNGMVLKHPNPLDDSKSIIVLGGRRTRGTHAAILAFTRKYKELESLEKDGKIEVIVKGIDKDGDGVVDDIEILGD